MNNISKITFNGYCLDNLFQDIEIDKDTGYWMSIHKLKNLLHCPKKSIEKDIAAMSTAFNPKGQICFVQFQL